MKLSYKWDDTSSQSRAVAYYRHSAEDKQENSVAIQRELTHAFADENNIEIIHEEVDEGKSGLIAKRPGFQSLFDNWVNNDNAPEFTYVLVYDISRWGRFQDQDEAGSYQHDCTKRGKKVMYVQHGFQTGEDSFMINIRTALERSMAAKFSKDLSDKVFFGSKKVSEQGFSAGGMAAYGLGRLLLDIQKKPIRVLSRGEHKQISNERVTFVPLNNAETELVSRIFHLFVHENKSPREIVQTLNREGLVSATNSVWDRDKVVRILSNEAYIGTRIYNKTWNRLKKGKKNNPRRDWVISPNAFEGIVNKETFAQAQQKLHWYTLQYKNAALALQRSRKRVNAKLLKLIEKNSSFDKDQHIAILDQIPTIFSIGSEISQKITQWCFVIPEDKREYSSILAVGVTPDVSESIEYVFLIPTNHFTESGLCIVRNDEKSFEQYVVSPENLDPTLDQVIEEVANKKKRA